MSDYWDRVFRRPDLFPEITTISGMIVIANSEEPSVMALAVNDILECTVFCRHPAGQNQLNRIHYKITALATPGDDQQKVAKALAEFLADAYDNILPTASKFSGLALRRIRPTKTQVTVGLPSEDTPGTRGGDPLPPQTAPVVSIRSLGAPLRTRGRMYLPSPSEADCNADGELENAYQADAIDFMDIITTAVVLTVETGSVSLQLGLYSPSNLTLYPITNYFIRQRFATQMRRSAIGNGDRPLQ